MSTNDPEDNFLTYEDYAPNNPNAVEIYHDREKIFIWSNGKFNKQYLTFNYYIKDILS